VRIVKDAVARMTGMLDQVMLIGRADADRMEFRPEPTDPTDLAQSIARETEQALSRRGAVRLEARAPQGARLLDARLLTHVLGNLLSNAIKYSPPGSPVVLEMDAESDALTFRVIDQGIGIPLDDQARLFESFHRARNVGNVAGTGLGLTIVKQCVELHGGRVEFESAPGCGSRFTVRVPAPAA